MDITHYLPERARNSFIFWNLSGTLKYSRIKSTHLCNKNLFYLEFEIFLQFFIHSEYSVICISELNITLQNPVLDRHCFFEYISNNKKSMNKIRIDLRKEDIITSFFYVTLSKRSTSIQHSLLRRVCGNWQSFDDFLWNNSSGKWDNWCFGRRW